MTNRYTCVRCGGKLEPEYIGAAIRVFKHGFNSSCPNDQAELKRGSDQVNVEDVPVVMIGGRGLSYPRAGLIRYFQCELNLAHADYHRGEISMGGERVWKRCHKCGGEMVLRVVRLHLDGSVEPYVAFKRNPDAEPVDRTVSRPVGLSDAELLKKFIHKVPKKFKRVKSPNSTKRVELHLSGDKPYRKNGKAFSRRMVVIADSETQTIMVVMYGCMGWSPEIKKAGAITGIPLDIIKRPSYVTDRPSRKKKGPA